MKTTPSPEPAPYTGIYGMHKYWSKKPHNIVRDYILRYSKIGDILVDPFCGSGVSIVEGVYTGRSSLGIDINPSAIRIARHTLQSYDLSQIEHGYTILQKKCREEIENCYRIHRGGALHVASHFIWAKDTLSEVWYNDPKGKGIRVVDSATPEDKEKALSYKYETIPHFFPKTALIYNTRINISKGQSIYHLFTPRNLFALSILWHHIQKIEDFYIREFFSTVFTSALGQASKMVFVIRRRGKVSGKTRGNPFRKEVGSWVIGYWIPKEHFEINVWDVFMARYLKIFKAKRQQARALGSSPPQEFSTLTDFLPPFKDGIGYGFFNGSAIDILAELPDHSIDYIITDPPHGNRIPYLELSLIWNSWFQANVDYTKELIVSDAKSRQKTKKNYYVLFEIVVRLCEQKLKDEKYFTLMFNSLDDDTWEHLFHILHAHKFILVDVGILGYSASSVIQDCRKNGLKTDFVFTFQKQAALRLSPLRSLPHAEIESILIQKFDELFKINGNHLKPYQFLNHVISEQLGQGVLIPISTVILFFSEKWPNIA